MCFLVVVARGALVGRRLAARRQLAEGARQARELAARAGRQILLERALQYSPVARRIDGKAVLEVA